MMTETEITAAARAKFERIEAEVESLTPEQVGSELSMGLWEVSQNMNPGKYDEDPYIVRRGWTLKGLRWQLACERYLETLIPPEDGDDTGSAIPVRSNEQKAKLGDFTDNISIGLANMHGLTVLLDEMVAYQDGRCISEDPLASIALTTAMRRFAKALKAEFDTGIQELRSSDAGSAS